MEHTQKNMIERKEPITAVSRVKGCLVGGAVGDALGAPAEFMHGVEIKRKYGERIEMVGGGTFNWRPGQGTDDTDQTIAIVDSLIEIRGYDPEDIANRFLAWYNSHPKDIGSTTAMGLSQLNNGASYRESGVLAKHSASNGSLMRTHPLGLFFRQDLDQLDQDAAEVSAITHANSDCILACQMGSKLVAYLANGLSKDQAIEALRQRYSGDDNSREKLEKSIRGEVFKTGDMGYVFNTFSIALNSFLEAERFEETVLKAIYAGGDTDTQATVAGAFAGAFYGIDAVPLRWKSKLNPFSAVEIEEKAEKLFLLSRV